MSMIQSSFKIFFKKLNLFQFKFTLENPSTKKSEEESTVIISLAQKPAEGLCREKHMIGLQVYEIGEGQTWVRQEFLIMVGLFRIFEKTPNLDYLIGVGQMYPKISASSDIYWFVNKILFPGCRFGENCQQYFTVLLQ